MLRRCLLTTISLLASASLLTAQTPPSQSLVPASTETASQQEEMADPQIGDHWTYEVRDEITGDLKLMVTHTITDVSATEISVRQATLGKPGTGFMTYDRSWSLINNGLWRSTPNDGMGIRAPLEVGKSWPVKSTGFNTSSGVGSKITGTSKVTAKETVTTPAGTFEAYKVETSVQSRNTNDATKKIQAEQQTWYAPAINHWVRRTFVSKSEGRVRTRSSVELVEYGRR